MLLHYTFIDAKLRIERGLYRTRENAQTGKPTFLAFVASPINGKLEQFKQLVGTAIRGVLYPSREYVRFVA